MEKITKEKLIELLNKDLALEYTACVQYTQHQGVLKGAMYQSMQKELIIHAQEELAHATILASQIDYLGGVPTVDMPSPKISKDSIEMLTQDLAGENDAISRYIARVRQAEELNLYHLAQQLRNILAVEQEHAMDLEQALGK
ncbi:ferritin [candidate division WOR-1 bacterium RIFOXYA2_FULL_37_7]|uniref:Ferritin n=1 Tax=candidate division WOR-1 bacterium RIFOXYB2_FULL_37_13 TaxID=1802579 RepID=A0A1F4SMK8_UNCSA|nr:MAG: ferritin [candidate division WOR-1 bacterium RIFOXYA2_FULL_37_7]OGC21676.1 MAG: ferritin [candidate division WOR-1 bacterium RIFOXYB2_FULL_37_13]